MPVRQSSPILLCGENIQATATDSPIADQNEIIKTKKAVRASDKVVCGNVIAEYKDNIIIIHGEFVSHQLMIPKSKSIHVTGKNFILIYPIVCYLDLTSEHEEQLSQGIHTKTQNNFIQPIKKIVLIMGGFK